MTDSNVKEGFAESEAPGRLSADLFEQQFAEWPEIEDAGGSAENYRMGAWSEV